MNRFCYRTPQLGLLLGCAFFLLVKTVAAGADDKDTIDSIKAKKPPAKPPTKTTHKAPPKARPKTVVSKPKPAAPDPSALLVSPLGTTPYRTIGAALQKVRPGGKIRLHAGLYRESLKIDKPVEIEPELFDPGTIVIESASAPVITSHTEAATLRGLTLRIRPGSPAAYTVDVAGGKLMLEDCDLSGGSQGCLQARGSGAVPYLRHCVLHGAGAGGMLLSEKADATLENCEITDCETAGIHASSGSRITLLQSRVHGGKAEGLLLESAQAACTQSDFRENGKAGVSVTDGGSATLRGCTLQANNDGGMLLLQKSHASLDDCTIVANKESGLRALGSELNARNCRIREDAKDGITYRDESTGTVEGCEIWKNQWNGIVSNTGSNPVVRGCKIHDQSGCALLFSAAARGTVEDSDVSATINWPCVGVTGGSEPVLRRVQIFHSKHEGIRFWQEAKGLLEDCNIYSNGWHGIEIAEKSDPIIRHCQVHGNTERGIRVLKDSAGTIEGCDIFSNHGGNYVAGPGAHPVLKENRMSKSPPERATRQ